MDAKIALPKHIALLVAKVSLIQNVLFIHTFPIWNFDYNNQWKSSRDNRVPGFQSRVRVNQRGYRCWTCKELKLDLEET